VHSTVHRRAVGVQVEQCPEGPTSGGCRDGGDPVHNARGGPGIQQPKASTSIYFLTPEGSTSVGLLVHHLRPAGMLLESSVTYIRGCCQRWLLADVSWNGAGQKAGSDSMAVTAVAPLLQVRASGVQRQCPLLARSKAIAAGQAVPALAAYFRAVVSGVFQAVNSGVHATTHKLSHRHSYRHILVGMAQWRCPEPTESTS
jgi:hypothetical protein